MLAVQAQEPVVTAPHAAPVTAEPAPLAPHAPQAHVPTPVPVWNPNTPLPKMKNTSIVPLALVVALVGGAVLIVFAAGIFTFFWHDLRTFKDSRSELDPLTWMKR